MTHTHRLSFVVLLFFFFVSCQKSDDTSVEAGKGSSSPSKIRFDEPKIGQKSLYVLLRGKNYRESANTDFEYLKDTLCVEIVGRDSARGWLVSERLAAGSASLHGENNVAYADSEFQYYFQSKGYIFTTASLDERLNSRLFFLYSADYPYLTLLDYQAPELQIKGWKTSLPYAESYRAGFVKNYNQLGVTYNRLNVVVNNKDMQTAGGVGNTHVFSAAAGLVRSSEYNRHTQQGYGWDLLP